MVFLGAMYARHSMHTSQYANTYQLPMTLGNWRASDVNTDLESLQKGLGAQSMIFRSYTNGDDSVMLYLAYYKDVDSANLVHAPAVCYPGQGWTIKTDEIASINILNKETDVNRLIIQKGKDKELVYNWWQTGDAIIPRNSTNRFYQMYKSVLGQNPSTIWVRLSVSAVDNMVPNERLLMQFAGDLFPFLGNYFKD